MKKFFPVTLAGFELAHSKKTQHWTSPCNAPACARPPAACTRDPTPTGQRSARPEPHSILMMSSLQGWVFSIQNAIPMPLTTVALSNFDPSRVTRS